MIIVIINRDTRQKSNVHSHEIVSVIGVYKKMKRWRIMKKMKKSIVFILVFMLMVGCTPKAESIKPVEVATVPEVVEVEEVIEEVVPTYPVSIVNYDGNLLEVKEKPMRIASLVLGTDEMILGLVDQERVIGLSGKIADATSVSNVAKLSEKFMKYENNIEVILESNPDLVIGSSWVKKELVAQLKELNIPYYGYKTPNTLAEQKKIILDIAKLVGEEEKGIEVVKGIEARAEIVKNKVMNLEESEIITVMPYTMHGSTNAKGTIVDELFTLAGVKNAATEAGLEGRAKISKEILLEINPDAIMVMAWAKDDLTEFEAFVEALKNDESLAELKAIKNDRVYIASSRCMMIVSQYIIDGLEYVQDTAYPDLEK